MFKQLSLRIVAGMLFGSSGGVLWGVWYAASKNALLVKPDDLAQMNALLDAIMAGSGAGLIVGVLIGAARNPLVTAVAAVLCAATSAFLLSPGFPFGEARTMLEATSWAGALVALVAALFAVAVPRRRPPVPSS
jgi:hypothetical protein